MQAFRHTSLFRLLPLMLCLTSLSMAARTPADSTSMSVQAGSAVSVADVRESGGLQQIYSEDAAYMPNPAGTIEAWVKLMPGVTSHSELSSQYAVRGGSFDENLVYVNDIEIYKPFLIRAGEQEGLTFVNPDMVSSLKFSAGGFDARYGDKMSSVLDVAYRRPQRNGGRVSLGLLSGGATLEGLSRDNRLTWLAGYRYKTPKALLSSLDAKGTYDPRFQDFQTYMTYRLNPAWNVSLLGYASGNRYVFRPESRETSFGTLDDVHTFTMYYDGQEKDAYRMALGALTAAYQPSAQLRLKWTVSATRLREKEFYDIESSYLLDRTDTDDAPADSVLHIGVGSVWQHARNRLSADMVTLQHDGLKVVRNALIRWSLQWQQDSMEDACASWEMADSAGYVLPSGAALHAANRFTRNRFSGYVQSVFRFDRPQALWHLTTGVRGTYNDLNGEWLVSPRASLSLYPKQWPAWSFHASSGLYAQPPFYKEMRNSRYVLNTEMRAQRSVHFVLETDWDFSMWDRPFRLSGAGYVKQYDRLVPYKLENVRTVYAGENCSDGYAVGADLRLNGCFVPDAESSLSVSWMRTREDIAGDGYGSFPRPTDERLSVNLFFQDYLPGNDSWRVHLNVLYGTALPCSYPYTDRYDLTFRMRPYRRVDIGLSKDFGAVGLFKDIRLQAEVFNLFDISNTVSYLWARTLDASRGEGYFAVPNHLTGRHLNVVLHVSF